MFQATQADLKGYIEQLEERVSQKIVDQKELKDKISEEEINAHRIEEELVKLTRTGRQPLNRSSRQKKSNKSFVEEDEDDYGEKAPVMVVQPENEDDAMCVSPQTQ